MSAYRSKNISGAKENKIKNLTLCAFCTAIICLCTFITVPSAIPFTMQTFGIYFALSFLGGRRGLVCILAYIALGAAGLPIFTGFRGGIGVLFQTTGGYIVGFIFVALSYLAFTELISKKPWVKVMSLTAGTLIMYIFGTVWYVILSVKSGAPVGIGAAFAVCVLPFIIPDAVKMLLALTLSGRISKAVLKKY